VQRHCYANNPARALQRIPVNVTETALHRLGKNSTGKCVKGCQFEHTLTVQQKPLPQVLGGNGIRSGPSLAHIPRKPTQQ
jgi:hypothetical protein